MFYDDMPPLVQADPMQSHAAYGSGAPYAGYSQAPAGGYAQSNVYDSSRGRGWGTGDRGGATQYAGSTPWALPSPAQLNPDWSQSSPGHGLGASSPWSANPYPYPTTPAGSWGAPTPASSWGPATPQSGNQYAQWSAADASYPQAYPAYQYDSGYATPHSDGSALGQPLGASQWFGGGGAGITRSNSHGRSRSRSRAGGRLVRSNSYGGGTAAGSYYAGLAYGRPYNTGAPAGYSEDNLARRPRDWRADYNPRQGLGSLIPRLGRSRSTVEEISDTVRRNLHALLQYHPQPPVYQDLRLDPAIPGVLQFPILTPRVHNELDLAQLVCTPPTPHMRLYHPRLPWYVDVYSQQDNGITVGDVVRQLHAALYAQIHGRHFWNEELSELDRARLGKVYQERCALTGDRAAGIRRVDFLGERCIWEGLARGKNGMWEIKTGRI